MRSEAAKLARLEAQVLGLLEEVKPYSRELYSELRAHVSFCTRNAHQYIDNGGTSLRVQQSDFTLRSICYAGPDLIEALYKKFGDDKGIGEIQKRAKEETGLDLHDIRAGYLNETFETSIGIEMMLPIYLELSAGEDGITFTLPDGENLIDYTLDSFRITVTKFGAISVDFQFNLGTIPEEGVTVSHLRVFEAMMGGHMGVFESIWNDYPMSEEEFEFVSPEAINFVATFRKFSQWVQLAKKHFPNGAEHTAKLREIENEILVRWEEEFNQFGDMLKDPSRSILYDEDEAQLSGLQTVYQDTRQAFADWEWLQSDLDTDDATDKQLKDQARRLFPAGRLYFYLSGIGEEIIKRFQRLLVNLAEGYEAEAKANKSSYRYRKDDIRGQFWFEREYGWQTVNLVNQLVLRHADGTIYQPMTPIEIQKQLVEHPDFKGFQVTSREARAGIDDWYFATQLDISKTNLATIRSHTTDVFYAEQNRVFIYMPDDPQFITEQYVDTANWAGNLAVVLIATQIFCKELIEDVESQLNNYENGSMAEDELRVLRGKIQITNRRIEQVMDLVRGFAMTKYVDHSELLRAIVKSSRVDFLAGILQDHATTLNRYYGYMGDLLAGHVRYGDA
ncbi:MAG: hypothetical protein MUE54_12030 [Anaerolineae bacterium]|nr:hypothetical protein [Anaerolineae bacterium]